MEDNVVTSVHEPMTKKLLRNVLPAIFRVVLIIIGSFVILALNHLMDKKNIQNKE